jgi:hypothetical protein
MRPNPEKLTCVSIIVCDDVFRDEWTKKLVVVGTFNQITAKEFPCLHRQLHVLFTLTNGRGEYDLSLSIEHERTGKVVAEIRGPLVQESPLAMNDVNVQLGNLLFEEEGKYWVVLKADNAIIGQRPIVVRSRPDQGPKGGTDDQPDNTQQP